MRPIAFYPVLGPRQLARRGTLADRLDRPDATRTSHGRGALRLIARELGRDATVVVPDLLCASAVEPFAQEGLRVERFRVLGDLNPDMDDLERALRPGPQALMLVSYLGLAQPFDAVRALCSEHGVKLIDDGAHSLLSDHDGRPYGTLGDAGVTGIRKTLPTPDGAVLFRGSLVPDPAGADGRVSSLPYVARTAARHADALLRTDVLGRRARARSGALPEGDSPAVEEHLGWSRLTERVVAAVDVERERALRRESYARWPELIDGAEPLRGPQPEPGACPSGFPARVRDEERFARRMQELRVEWIRWPDRPRDSAEFPHGFAVLPTHTVPRG